MSSLRIVFMGTPDFAVASLDILVKNNYNIVGVVTAADKPAGRGQKIQESAVKKYAVSKGLKVLQPIKLKDEEFLDALRSLKADLQVIVAFRMLPEVVWNMPPLGSINLHGSLLPQYRGAAPINWAVINGETETGVSTFFLQHKIDTGNIIFQERIPILENDNAGVIHDKLMVVGAELVLKTIIAIERKNYPQVNQADIIKDGELIKEAPKIFKADCRIDWTTNAESIHNLIRGLSPYPAAFTELINPDGKKTLLKVFSAYFEENEHNYTLYNIVSDGKNYLKVALNNGFMVIEELQLAGKKRMSTVEFLRGSTINNDWKVF